VIAAAKQQIVVADRSQASCELLDKVTRGDPLEDGAIGFRQPWITGATLALQVFEQLLTKSHAHSLPRLAPVR